MIASLEAPKLQDGITLFYLHNAFIFETVITLRITFFYRQKLFRSHTVDYQITEFLQLI